MDWGTMDWGTMEGMMAAVENPDVVVPAMLLPGGCRSTLPYALGLRRLRRREKPRSFMTWIMPSIAERR